MTMKRVLLPAVLALLAIPWGVADASVRIGIGIGVPVCRPYYPYRVYVAPPPVVVVGPGYYAPAPVYVAPPPGVVYVQQPAPVYVQPAPGGYVQQQPVAVPVQQNGLPPQPVPVPR